MKKIDQENAIMRFKECHFGESPSDKGYNFIEQYQDKYVYGKNEESINAFFKFEKLASHFRIASVIFLLTVIIIGAWIFTSNSWLSVIIFCLLVFLGYVYISCMNKAIDKHINIIEKNIITIKKNESHVN